MDYKSLSSWSLSGANQNAPFPFIGGTLPGYNMQNQKSSVEQKQINLRALLQLHLKVCLRVRYGYCGVFKIYNPKYRKIFFDQKN